jgi:hypothetical protein
MVRDIVERHWRKRLMKRALKASMLGTIALKCGSTTNMGKICHTAATAANCSIGLARLRKVKGCERGSEMCGSVL